MPRDSRFSAIVLAIAAMTLPVSWSCAQGTADYPSRPIRMIVPFPPGGGADLTARLVALKMSDSMRQPVVVDNRPGANGLIGTDAVAKSAPDGYTVLLVDRGALGINPSLYAKLPYDPMKDFAYVGIATEAPYVLVVNASLPVKNLAELSALAKAKPSSIRYGSFGVGSMPQLNVEALTHRLGVDLRHIPYKGAAAAVSAVVSGEVEVALVSAPSVLGFLKEGRLRAIVVGSKARLRLIPEVPTLTEAGIDEDLLAPTYFAMAAAAGTPPAIVARLGTELHRAVKSPDVAEKLAANGLIPVGGSSEAMAGLVASDITRFAVLTKAIGLKPE